MVRYVSRNWASLGASLIVIGLSFMVSLAQASTLSHVRENGYVNCGVSDSKIGFSEQDGKDSWKGLGVSFCRAIAAAIFNDINKVKFVALSPDDAISALQSGNIEILMNSVSWTLKHDAGLGLLFTGILLHDGQGFMVPKKLGISSALELSGASICVLKEQSLELKASKFFKSKKMPFKLIPYDTRENVTKAYQSGLCNVFTDNILQLAIERVSFDAPGEHIILPDILSKRPKGPIVRQGDDQWFNLVKWVLFALINAEELGITRDNVSSFETSEDPEVRALLGQDDQFGKFLGLPKDWAKNMLLKIGNYGELFDQNMGQRSPLKIDRGPNKLWDQGGLLFAPPLN
ncbi:MAG: amino acid ABC transporter substrate-binding protein [Methyloligellaceae bacterium]